jgi:hypothetical protein
MPTMLRVGFSASCFAVATDRNSGECITFTSGYCRWIDSVVPGSSVDLMTTVLPLPTSPMVPRTMLSSKPSGRGGRRHRHEDDVALLDEPGVARVGLLLGEAGHVW